MLPSSPIDSPINSDNNKLINQVLFITDVFGWESQDKFTFYNNGFLFWIPTIYIYHDGFLVFAGWRDRFDLYVDGEWLSLLNELYIKALIKHYEDRYRI